jgi:hypothetical protein
MEGTGPHDEALFRYLVGRLETEAWLGLGKIVNPATGKAERQLELAKLSIDVLAMIERKTESFRNEAESKLIRGTLTTLRLNYVEEASKPAESPESAAPPAASGATGGETSSDEAAPGQDLEEKQDAGR